MLIFMQKGIRFSRLIVKIFLMDLHYCEYGKRRDQSRVSRKMMFTIKNYNREGGVSTAVHESD